MCYFCAKFQRFSLCLQRPNHAIHPSTTPSHLHKHTRIYDVSSFFPHRFGNRIDWPGEIGRKWANRRPRVKPRAAAVYSIMGFDLILFDFCYRFVVLSSPPLELQQWWNGFWIKYLAVFFFLRVRGSWWFCGFCKLKRFVSRRVLFYCLWHTFYDRFGTLLPCAVWSGEVVRWIMH